MEPGRLWLNVLDETQHALMFVGVVIFLTIPKQGKRDFIELGLMMLVPMVTETLSDIGYYLLKANVNLMSNLYHIFIFPLFVSLFRRKANWKNKDTIAYGFIIGFLCFALLNLFLIQGIHHINSYTRTISSVGIILISIAYFYKLIKELPTESITSLPMFWISAAFLIYRSGSFFIYLTTDYLINVLGNDMVEMWSGLYFLGLIFYSMLCYALLLIRSQYLNLRPGTALNG